MNFSQFIIKACEDGAGNVSSGRIIVMTGCAVCLLLLSATIICTLAGVQAAKDNFTPIATALGGTMAGLLGYKLGQNAQE